VVLAAVFVTWQVFETQLYERQNEFVPQSLAALQPTH